MTGTITRRPEDLGGMGESYFRLLAKDAGLVANAATDDKAGWDFEVELPNPRKVDYSNQSRPVYRVQVKATMGNDSAVSLTFSSLLSLVQYGGPAYILLLRFGDDLLPKAAYLHHIDENLSTEILTSLRRREVSDPTMKLNKAKMTLRFEPSTELRPLSGGELSRRLEAALGSTYWNYLDSKTKWLRQIEEDSTRWRFNIRFEDEEAVRAMAECFLGYEEPFNVSSIGYMAPLGIPDEELVHPQDFRPTTVKPIEEALPRALIRLSTSAYGPTYEFKAILYSVPTPVPLKFAAMRIHTAMFDIIYRHATQALEFRAVNLTDDALRAPANEFRGFVKYMGEARASDTTFIQVITTDSSAPLSLSLNTHSVGVSEDFEDIQALVEALYLKLSSLNLSTELVRPADIFDRRSHLEFLQHAGGSYEPPLSFEFQTDDDVSQSAQVVVFNSPINLEGKTVLCFAAFYGTVEVLGGGTLRGNFTRSEYLGEIVVPTEADIYAARKLYGDKLQEALRKRGFEVL
jgi:hypothetical protein